MERMEFAEHDLVSRFQRGDRLAFEQVVRRWDTDILNLALRMLGDLDDARDLRQAVFIRAWERRHQYDGRARFSTWLYRVAINLCRDQLRSVSARRRLRARAAAHTALPPGPPDGADDVARRETAARVADAVADLPAPQREVVVLRHVQHLSFAEIGLIVGAPDSTVRARMRQALARLRSRLVDADPRLSECS